VDRGFEELSGEIGTKKFGVVEQVFGRKKFINRY